MKSVSVIDKAFTMSEPSKIINELTNTNNSEKLEEFKKEYIMPYLKERNIEMPDSKTLIDSFKTINDYTMGFIKRWRDGHIRKYLEKKFNFLNFSFYCSGDKFSQVKFILLSNCACAIKGKDSSVEV